MSQGVKRIGCPEDQPHPLPVAQATHPVQANHPDKVTILTLCLEKVAVTEKNVAVIVDDDKHLPPRLEHPKRPLHSNPARHRRQVLQQPETGDNIEATVNRKLIGRPDHRLHPPGDPSSTGVGPALSQHRLRHIDGGHLSAETRDLDRNPTDTATDIKPPFAVECRRQQAAEGVPLPSIIGLV